MVNSKEVLNQLCKEYEAGLLYKQGRVKDWQGTEDQYFGKIKKALKGQFNIPLPIMSGYIDTLLSKISDAPNNRFKPSAEADFRKARKIQAMWDAWKNSEDNDLDSKDLDAKKLAAMYGVGIFKVYGESDPKFRICVHVVDPLNFFVDPMGGRDLENSRYNGEDSIFKSKSMLIEGAKAGYYDRAAVARIVNGLTPNTTVENDNQYKNKQNRLAALGLSSMMSNFIAEGMSSFIEQGTTIDGVRHRAVWSYEKKEIILLKKLKEDFESDLWFYTSWATHPDIFNFWSKAPADDIRPVGETIRVLINQEVTNRNRRNLNMRAYDPEMFPNAADLEFRQDGLVATKNGISSVRPIADGIFQFETPELNGTLNLANYLDNMSGQKTGITPASQGVADETKVGIYEGNMQQVADRMGLYNKSYTKCYRGIGRRFVWAAKEHLNEKMAVRLIGEKGVEWDTLVAKEIDPNIEIIVESSVAELRMSELKKSKKTAALEKIQSNPKLMDNVNLTWLTEQMLLNGEFDDEAVRVALDKENDGNREILARASEAIEEIVEGKNPKLFRGANTAFQQKILDFALDNTDDDFELYQRLLEYIHKHDDIVVENMTRKALKQRSQAGMGLPPAGPQGQPPQQGGMNPMQDMNSQPQSSSAGSESATATVPEMAY
jgi:hypothetical protein